MSRAVRHRVLVLSAVAGAALLPAVASATSWTGGISQDPMNDAETGVLRGTATAGQSQYALRIKCQKPDVQVLQLAVTDADGKPLPHAPNWRLEYRLDKTPAGFLVPRATDYANVFTLVDKNLTLSRLLAAKQLALRGYRGDETPVFTFQWDAAPSSTVKTLCASITPSPVAAVAPPPPSPPATAVPAAADHGKALDDWKDAINDAVARVWVKPPVVSATIVVGVTTTLKQTETGAEVMAVKLQQSSGNGSFDASVMRALKKASPLPLPADPAVFASPLTLRFTPPRLANGS